MSERRKKAHIPLREKLAAALAHMLVEVDGKLQRAIPYEDARRMTADEVVSLFNFDHGIYEAIGGPTAHWNLTPRFIAEHRRKTAKIDRPAIAKSDRLSAAEQAFRAKLLRKTEIVEEAPQPQRPRSRLKGRPFASGVRKKIPSRPFPNKRGTP